MLIGKWKIAFNGLHTWRWALRYPFEVDAMWLRLLPYRGRGCRFLFWHICEMAPCTCSSPERVER